MTYEYLCSSCGHDWEADQRISEPPLENCPACGKKTARRMVSGGAGFILKGGGWYSDGYASAKAPKASEAGGGSGSSPKSSAGDGSGSSKSSATKKGDSATKSAAA
jgi:putative FmdB family regulatory protein